MAIGAVADRAVVGEQVAADRMRGRIVAQLLERFAVEARHDLLRLRLAGLLQLLMLPRRSPAQRAGITAEAGVQHQITHREGHRDEKHPQPPARQRIVVLGEVAVPGVAGGLGAGAGFGGTALAHRHHQPDGADDIERGEDNDECA